MDIRFILILVGSVLLHSAYRKWYRAGGPIRAGIKDGNYRAKTASGTQCEYWLLASRYGNCSFKMEVRGNSSARFNIAHEGVLEKAGKAVGLLHENKTGDRVFDEKVFIETDTPEDTQEILKSNEIREGILRLFDFGIVEIQGHADRIEISSGIAFRPNVELADRFLDQTSALLEAMILRKPITLSPEPMNWSGGFAFELGSNPVAIGVSALALALMVPAVGFISTLLWNPERWFYLALYTLPLGTFFVGAISHELNIRSSRRQHLAASPIYAFFALLMSLIVVFCVDQISPNRLPVIAHDSVVTRKYLQENRTKYGYKTSYMVSLTSKENLAETWERALPQDQFESASPGKTVLRVLTERGRLGIERMIDTEIYP